jgi:hypothetical protein
MSAWKRPCVVIGGGLEGPIWESYQQTTYLNTVGMLKCCWGGGCWRKKVKDCDQMVGEYPRCMNLITTDDVVNAIEKHYDGGRLIYPTI